MTLVKQDYPVLKLWTRCPSPVGVAGLMPCLDLLFRQHVQFWSFGETFLLRRIDHTHAACRQKCQRLMSGDSCGDDGGGGANWQIIVGIIIAVLASSASNLGVNVQKYGFMQEAKRPLEQRRPYVRLWRWWLGMVLVVFGAIGDFICFALGKLFSRLIQYLCC